MALKFTIYTWFEKDNRIQQSNFRRWNRRLKTNLEPYEVIVFYSDENAKIYAGKFENLRFWRLHRDLDSSPTALLNEAIRYARSEILVYVSPDIMARNTDLYRIANRVRADYLWAWFDSKKAIYPGGHRGIRRLPEYIRWIFNLGRIEMYTRLNSPYDFFKASFFAIQKEKLGQILKEASVVEREKLFLNDKAKRGYLNYYFFHLVNRSTMQTFNEGKSRSYDFSKEVPPLFYSYRNTGNLLSLIFKTGNFHYPLNIYRIFLPVMQMTQLAFFVLVWFSPWKSLNLLAFYTILASALIADLFFGKKKYNPVLVLFWFFSWLVA